MLNGAALSQNGIGPADLGVEHPTPDSLNDAASRALQQNQALAASNVLFRWQMRKVGEALLSFRSTHVYTKYRL